MAWASFAKGLLGGWQAGEQYSVEMAKNRREAFKAPYLDYAEIVKNQQQALTAPLQGEFDRADLQYKTQGLPYTHFNQQSKDYYGALSEKPKYELEVANAKIRGVDATMSEALQPHLQNAATLASFNNIMAVASRNIDPANPKPALDWARQQMAQLGIKDFLGAYENLPADQLANFMSGAAVDANNYISQRRAMAYANQTYPMPQQTSYSYNGTYGPNGQLVDPTASQVPAGFTTMLPAAAAPTAPPAVPSLTPTAAAPTAPAAPQPPVALGTPPAMTPVTMSRAATQTAGTYTPGTATTSPRVYIPATQPMPAGVQPYTPQQGMGTTAIVPNNTGMTRYYAGHPTEYRGR